MACSFSSIDQKLKLDNIEAYTTEYNLSSYIECCFCQIIISKGSLRISVLVKNNKVCAFLPQKIY
jgi:hypothetical protein